MKINDFIKHHMNIGYCNAIMYPNGDVEYVEGPHKEFVAKLYCDKHNIDYDNFNVDSDGHEIITMNDMLLDLGVILIMYDNITYPCKNNIPDKDIMITPAQEESICELINHDCIQIPLVIPSLDKTCDVRC